MSPEADDKREPEEMEDAYDPAPVSPDEIAEAYNFKYGVAP